MKKIGYLPGFIKVIATELDFNGVNISECYLGF